jgi:glycosyltransferase involved in cell wall biosynthesis
VKICLITNIYEPYKLGGTEFYVKGLTKSIKKKGHDIFVISTCPPGKAFPGVINEIIDGVKVYRFYPWNVYWGYRAQERSLFLKPFWHLVDQWNPHVYFTVRRILSKELPDVIHIHNMGGFSNSIFWACRGYGRKVVYTIHDYISICPKSILLRADFEMCKQMKLPCRLYQMIKRWSLSGRVDVCISPSSFNAELHKHHGILKNGNYAVIPYGIEITGGESGMKEAVDNARAGDNDVNLLYLGQVVRHKGLSVLTQAFEETKRDDVRLHIAGDGDYIEHMQRELGDNSKVTFYGHVSGDAKESLFSRSDALVLPSICYDNAPLSISEAYKYGLPVIGSSIGGIPEMIRENKTGFLFEPGNISSLASILRRISLEQLRRMTHDCQKAAKTYTMENHLEKLLSLYDNLTS